MPHHALRDGEKILIANRGQVDMIITDGDPCLGPLTPIRVHAPIVLRPGDRASFIYLAAIGVVPVP